MKERSEASEDRPLREYSVCAECGETILRFPDGIWEHAEESRNWDHVPSQQVVTEYRRWESTRPTSEPARPIHPGDPWVQYSRSQEVKPGEEFL